MAEFIGAKISLISKRDIRYVGILHQISSEDSTVALEQVVSYGTEGRRPDDEVPASLDNTYDYIVFRGSDVKDLRIEETPKQQEAPKAKVPDDPAILGSTRKPATPSGPQSGQAQTGPPTGPHGQQQQQQHNGPRGQGPPQFPQNQYNQGPGYGFYPPPNQRFGPGPQGFPPPGPGYPGMPYGAPPGWYPPYGNFPHPPPGQFPNHQMPIGPPGQGRGQMQQGHGVPGAPGQQLQGDRSQNKQEDKPAATVKLPSSSNTPIPLQEAPSAPPPPAATKPDVAAALAPPANNAPTEDKKQSPSTTKSGRIVPAIPRAGSYTKPAGPANGDSKASNDSGAAPNLTKAIEDANRDARAAVAAAMAKLPVAQGQPAQQDTGAIDNLTKKVNEMRTSDNVRGRGTGPRGGRGAGRGEARKVEVPKTDYDFESANAKFNKQDLVKEAIATGSPIGTPGAEEGPDAANGPTSNGRKNSETVIIPAANSYNKNSSFFDDISSESKDRATGQEQGQKLGGREFRSEERQKNMETFGQGSVDNGFRFGRGRGRGRGRGPFRGEVRGRGGYRGDRGGPRGGRGGYEG